MFVINLEFNQQWNKLPDFNTLTPFFADSDFDLKLSQHFSTPESPLPSSLVHQSLSKIKYKPKTISRGIQKKESSLAKKLIALQKRLTETELLYNQQKSINEDLTEIVEKYQMKEEEEAAAAVEEKKKAATKKAGGAFFHRKFQ